MLLRSVDKRLEKIEKRNRYVNFLGNGMTDKEDESMEEVKIQKSTKHTPSKSIGKGLETFIDLPQFSTTKSYTEF